MPATSEPAPGSVTPTAVMVSPAKTPGRYFSSWRLVPKRTRCGLAMSVCTSTVMAKPPWVERPTSSASTTEARASRPAPPSASGTRREKKPRPPIWRSTSRGTKPASSHLGPCGFTSSSTKRRSWRRMRSWSSVKIGCCMQWCLPPPFPAPQAGCGMDPSAGCRHCMHRGCTPRDIKFVFRNFRYPASARQVVRKGASHRMARHNGICGIPGIPAGRFRLCRVGLSDRRRD